MSLHPPSFEELAQKFERELYLTCYGILGHREDAADALQETMLRAWRGFRGFRGEAQWRTWFHRIAVNTCIDMIRKRKPETSLNVMREEGFDPADPRVNVSGELEADERKRRLREAIGKLDEKDRTLIVLRDVRGAVAVSVTGGRIGVLLLGSDGIAWLPPGSAPLVRNGGSLSGAILRGRGWGGIGRRLEHLGVLSGLAVRHGSFPPNPVTGMCLSLSYPPYFLFA